MSGRITLDGNGAVAHIAYRVNEVCAIYPITPSSTMAELADEWAADGHTNIWGNVPVIQEMQSEGGAAGAVHGALQGGAMTTTFTSSQGLLLMLPNMFKIAGELSCTVFHVAARAVATQALSIFGDHTDVMAVRGSGFAMLSSASVQEAHDSALIAQAATLRGRVPFLHFFDGFRTSHELNTIDLVADEIIRAMIDDTLVRAHRARALSPEAPFIRGTAHNPDTFFQARESVNPYYQALPAIVQDAMDRFATLTGRQYHLFDYSGAADATRVIVLMGSGAETARAVAALLNSAGEAVGVLQVRLFRPFSAAHLVAALPASCTRLTVLEQAKEPGAAGEPLYLDVLAALAQAVANGARTAMPRVTGGRYGLGSKNFSPAMARAVFDELRAAQPKNSYTIGIDDDVSHSSLAWDPTFHLARVGDQVDAVFYGLGADGTVGANKNSAKILGEDAGRNAQAYFVYDSHKSGARTVSHLRFGAAPIHAPYLVERADFVACHQFHFLLRQDLLSIAAPGAIFLLNTVYGPQDVWMHLPRPVQRQILDKQLRLHVIDASSAAREAGLAGLTNTILQTCFFALCGVLPREQAIERIKASIAHSYASKGTAVVQANFAAVDGALARLHAVAVPDAVSGELAMTAVVPASAPPFVRKFIAIALEGRGDLLPVSAMPVDGSYPSATSMFEKRNISDFVPVWEPGLCIQCGQCSVVCPHSVIRSRYYHEDRLGGAPPAFKSAPVNARGFPHTHFTLQLYVEDCTGCGLCIEACPADSVLVPDLKALNLHEKAPLLAAERLAIGFFEGLPVNDRARVNFASISGVQFLEPTFEFSGACAGCGETPYLKLLSQLFGDRAMIANATGCSSIYGGNLPVTPWSKNSEGRGPAWSNSLFEDNAEFGLGFRLAADQQLALARSLLAALAPAVGAPLAQAILAADQTEESAIRAQRDRVAQLKTALAALDLDAARDLLSVVDHLVRRSIWLVGGDGWAYDIDSGGLDHVLASGRDVNVLVLDTEVYSNTGGQASKATPLGAVAKFASAGKRTARKDLALQMMAYGNVYVAQVALGANAQQTLQAFREAEAYSGPSIILAYSHCIAHGIDMRQGMHQQDLAVACGYWPLLRFSPPMGAAGRNPFRLDSPRPSLPFAAYAGNELRYTALARRDPGAAATLMAAAQRAVTDKYRQYEHLASDTTGRHRPQGA
ncbi:pyruvate:ferredoxin (flavodoxin) oxidoreductase [Massilia sp. DWR3-1-1]|uniref:pyruvate:ferredoxin (flavodoxin) oxidoreductase n=1 Tax=Massilia sp. DWR3-1-1 TaxID=2804559 RepID=UPI003CF130A6